MKTYLGKEYDFDFLRAWIKCPFTLEKHEDKALRDFIESHGIEVEKSDFGWFFATYYLRNVQFAQSEIDCLLKLVDEMEIFQETKALKDLNHFFGDLKIEFGKIGIALAFIKPRLYPKDVDDGLRLEINKVIKSYNRGMKKIERLEKVIIQTYGNVSSKKLHIEW